MPDVLLTHGYFLAEDEKEREIMRPYPTLGLLYLSSYLTRAGFSVGGLRHDLLEPRGAGRAAPHLGRRPASSASTRTSMTRAAVLDVARRAKAHGWTVVLGGPESANYPEEYLARGADVVVVGEGEVTMAELLPALAARGPHRLHGVAGIVFRDEDGGRRQEPREAEDPGPRLPPLARPRGDRPAALRRRLADAPRLGQRQPDHGARLRLQVQLVLPRRLRLLAPAAEPVGTADEVAHIVERWAPDQVWYADDVFTINHSWLFEYAAELKRRGLKVPFETISRADRMMKDEVLEALAATGLHADLDRLGERQPEDPRRDAAGRHRRSRSAGRRRPRSGTASRSGCS